MVGCIIVVGRGKGIVIEVVVEQRNVGYFDLGFGIGLSRNYFDIDLMVVYNVVVQIVIGEFGDCCFYDLIVLKSHPEHLLQDFLGLFLCEINCDYY